MCVCVHVCSGMHARMCTLPEDNPQVLSIFSSPFLSSFSSFLGCGWGGGRTCSLSDLEIAISARLAGQLATGICVAPSTFPASVQIPDACYAGCPLFPLPQLWSSVPPSSAKFKWHHTLRLLSEVIQAIQITNDLRFQSRSQCCGSTARGAQRWK